MSKKPIQVWPFCDAPKKYKAMSKHGGDEDWLAFVPYEYGKGEHEEIPYLPWMESGSSFGCCDVSREKCEADCGWVYIGAHA